MWERDETRNPPHVQITPRGNHIRHAGRRTGIGFETAPMITDRVDSDRQDQFDLRHGREDPIVPKVTTLRTRREVALVSIIAGEAESHGHDCYTNGIVEDFWIYAHPVAQPCTGWIIERNATGMGPQSRSLARDHEPSFAGNPEDRARFVRQRAFARIVPANPASRDFMAEIHDRLIVRRKVVSYGHHLVTAP